MAARTLRPADRLRVTGASGGATTSPQIDTQSAQQPAAGVNGSSTINNGVVTTPTKR
jgi:hypothetical protein